MRLGIISDCVHFYDGNGEVATENHILLRQLETLSAYFSETLICCPFSSFDQKKVYSTYTKPSIQFIPLPNVGGNTIKEKLRLVTVIPQWLKTFRRVNAHSDIIYQRFPNNLNIPGFFYFYLNNKKVFATYTGTWDGYANEPATYRFQRWLLAKYFKGPVWVYINKSRSPKIRSGFSPSYSISEWDEETTQVAARINKIKNQPLQHLRLITVGTLIDYKNQLGILKACALLLQKNIAFHLSIVGDGPMKETLTAFIQENNLSNAVTLCGKKNHVELRELYRQHDFVVQAPLAEGFGKVPVEGFFHGVIPVINNIAMAGYMTEQGGGFLFDAADSANLAEVLQSLPAKQNQLPQMIERGRAFAQTQTLEAWAADYYKTITDYWNN